MPERRVVYPIYILDAPAFGKRYWSLLDQLMTSLTSYFTAGNTVPVIVGTDSLDVKETVERVAGYHGYPVEVMYSKVADIRQVAGKYAETICRDRLEVCRPDVVASKIFVMLSLGAEYDRLIVDIDTLWFGRVPWDRFGDRGMYLFAPEQWRHPLSITIGQMIYYRSRLVPDVSIEQYCRRLVDADRRWRALPLISTLPWPNSGIVYMTSEFARERYAAELDNPALPILSVEDETPLVSLLLSGGGYETEIGLNVPVAFTDITMEPDLLHPHGIICAHFHTSPKPDSFDITYGGVMRHPELHGRYSLAFLRDSMASGQYGSMSGILWCYVWRYYFSYAAAEYRNGEQTPVYRQEFWREILESYYSNRKEWLDSHDGQETIRGLLL